MTNEPLREQVFRKEVERCRREGVEPPYEMLGAPVGRLKDAINGFFNGFEEHRRRRAEDAEIVKEDRAWRRREARKVRRNDTKRVGRRTAAANTGTVVRSRTDLSGMSPEDAADHRREMDRNKKRRNRALEKTHAVSEVLSLQDLEALLSDLDLSACENKQTSIIDTSPQSPACGPQLCQAVRPSARGRRRRQWPSHWSWRYISFYTGGWLLVPRMISSLLPG